VVVFWREVHSLNCPNQLWSNGITVCLWCSKTVWSKLEAFHWYTWQVIECNRLLQPNVSASDSSSFIGPHHNPKCNTCLKVKNYHQGGRKHVHIKMTLFGLYLIQYQPHLSIFESFWFDKESKMIVDPKSSLNDPVLNLLLHHRSKWFKKE
jgi:hypothetical protein